MSRAHVANVIKCGDETMETPVGEIPSPAQLLEIGVRCWQITTLRSRDIVVVRGPGESESALPFRRLVAMHPRSKSVATTYDNDSNLMAQDSRRHELSCIYARLPKDELELCF